jgi:hypothetical protein
MEEHVNRIMDGLMSFEDINRHIGPPQALKSLVLDLSVRGGARSFLGPRLLTWRGRHILFGSRKKGPARMIAPTRIGDVADTALASPSATNATSRAIGLNY